MGAVRLGNEGRELSFKFFNWTGLEAVARFTCSPPMTRSGGSSGQSSCCVEFEGPTGEKERV